jgi:hypothetical protein
MQKNSALSNCAPTKILKQTFIFKIENNTSAEFLFCIAHRLSNGIRNGIEISIVLST